MARSSGPISKKEFAAMARHAGLDLAAGELDELRLGYHHLLQWINALRRDWRFEDEPAHCFTPPDRPE